MGISETADRLRTQDNRCTAEPMFCLQIKVRVFGDLPEDVPMMGGDPMLDSIGKLAAAVGPSYVVSATEITKEQANGIEAGSVSAASVLSSKEPDYTAGAN